MARYFDVETGEYFEADSLDGTDFELATDTQPQETGWLGALARGGTSGLTSLARGFSGIGRGVSDLVGFDTGSQFFDETTQAADDIDRRAAEAFPLEPGSAKSIVSGATAMAPQIGMAFIPGGGLVAGSTVLGAIQGGQKYDKLKDMGIDGGAAGLDALATTAVQTGANLLPLGAVSKFGQGGSLMSQFLKGSLAGAGAGVVGSGVSITGDILTDRIFAPENVPSPEEAGQMYSDAFKTSMLLGPVFKGGEMVSRSGRGVTTKPDAVILEPNVQPPDAPLGLPAPEGIYGDNFVANNLTPEQAAISQAMDFGPAKSAYSEVPLLEPAKGVSADPFALDLPSPTQTDGLITPEVYSQPRTPEQIAESLNVQAGATGLSNPILTSEGIPVEGAPPVDIARPVTSRGTIRQSLSPEEAAITDQLIRRSENPVTQKIAQQVELARQRSEEMKSAGYLQDKLQAKEPIVLRLGEAAKEQSAAQLREEAVGKSNLLDANEQLINRAENPKPILKAPDETTAITPKDGEPLISQDTSKGFWAKLKKEIESERGAIDPELLGLKGLKRKSKELEKIAPREEFKASKTMKLVDGVSGQIRMLDTLADQIPELRPYLDGIVEAPEMSTHYRGRLEKVLEDAFKYQGDKKVDQYVIEKDRLGANYRDTAEARVKAGLDEGQIRAVEAMVNLQKVSSQMLEEIATMEAKEQALVNIEALQYNKKLTPEQKAEEIKKINQRAQAKIQKAIKIRNEFDTTNYFPRNRDGNYVLEVFDDSSGQPKLVERRQFDSVKELNKFAKVVKPQYRIQYSESTVRTEKGINPDITEFLNSPDEVTVEGFSKHLLKRRQVGDPDAVASGYDTDTVKAWSEYATGLAKKMALTEMKVKLSQARRALPKDEDGNVTGATSHALKILQQAEEKLGNPKHPFFKFASKLADVSFLAGQLRAPLGDILGAVQRQYPEIGRWTPGINPEITFSKALGISSLKSAMPEAQFAKKFPELARGLSAAREKGVIQTNQGKKLEAIATGRNISLKKAEDALFFFKTKSDKFAEENAFISGWLAYPKAKKTLAEKGYKLTQQEFAEKFVRDTKGNPSSSIMPQFMNNQVGDVMLKYKKWQIAMLRGMGRSLKEGDFPFLLRTLGTIVGTAGVNGLPLAVTVDQALKAFGVDAKKEVRKYFESEDVADAVIYGPVSQATGVNISTAAGLGGVIPEMTDDIRSFVGGIAGVVPGLIDNTIKAGSLASKGEYGRALEKLPGVTPLTQNLMKMMRFNKEGVVTESGTGLLPADELTTKDKVAQMLGFQPLKVAKAYEKYASDAKAIEDARGESVNKPIGIALARGDREEAAKLQREAYAKGKKVDYKEVLRFKDKYLGKDTARYSSAPKSMRYQLMRDEELYDGN